MSLNSCCIPSRTWWREHWNSNQETWVLARFCPWLPEQPWKSPVTIQGPRFPTHKMRGSGLQIDTYSGAYLVNDTPI